MNNLSVTEVRSSTKRHIRPRLEQEFGEALHIIPNGKEMLLAYSDNFSMNDLVRDHYTIRKKLGVMDSNKQEELLTIFLLHHLLCYYN